MAIKLQKKIINCEIEGCYIQKEYYVNIANFLKKPILKIICRRMLTLMIISEKSES